MFFDTHAHLDDKRFNADRKDVIEKIKNSNISYVVNVGADIKTSQDTYKLTKEYDFIFGAVGVHPHDAKILDKKNLELIADLATKEKIRAIGEIGLDYYHDFSPRDVQQTWFIRQMDLAMDLKMPVVIHCRDAMADTLATLRRYDLKKYGGVMHCFSGSVESAKIITDMGMHISVGGPVTYKNAHATIEVVKSVPIHRLMLETDCPYLTPEPYRGQRNDCSNIPIIAQKIAQIRGLDIEQLAKITTDNAKEFFKI